MLLPGINGEFSFTTVKQDSVVLLFSFVGMKTKEVKWQGEKMLNVVLEEDTKEVEEVVVTGYQTVKKSNMAGSVSTVKAEDLVLTGTQSLEQAFAREVSRSGNSESKWFGWYSSKSAGERNFNFVR